VNRDSFTLKTMVTYLQSFVKSPVGLCMGRTHAGMAVCRYYRMNRIFYDHNFKVV
jgi:hypothetical protein